MFTKIVEPVVVNPETLSNQASVKEKFPFQSKYGKAPNRHDVNQLATTINNPSLFEILSTTGINIKGNKPKRPVIKALYSKGITVSSE
jgi:hypothetical protein